MNVNKNNECQYEEEHVTRRSRIEKAVKEVLGNLIRSEAPLVQSICNKEVVRDMIDDLVASCTRKVTKKLEAKQKKAVLATRRNDVNAVESHSPAGMTEAACKLGYTRGFVLN
jgi:hypothetical protein